jgi:hypothetical protein
MEKNGFACAPTLRARKEFEANLGELVHAEANQQETEFWVKYLMDTVTWITHSFKLQLAQGGQSQAVAIAIARCQALCKNGSCSGSLVRVGLDPVLAIA